MADLIKEINKVVMPQGFVVNNIIKTTPNEIIITFKKCICCSCLPNGAIQRRGNNGDNKKKM